MNIRESMPTNNLWHIAFIPVLIALSTMFVACEKNHAPIINEIAHEPLNTSAGTVYTITDDNGDYSISDLISRKDTLTASKEEFGPKEFLVSIPPNGILHYDIEMTSITLSTKAFGIITDQDGVPIRNAEIIVLNPNGTESKLKDYTDENGQYRILYVPHGEHKVVIRKTINEDYKYITIEEKVIFSEIEQRFDFVVHKISLRGSFTDTRDGQEYAYKTIGSQTWMLSNLAYLTRVYPPSELSTDKPRFYVYAYAGSDVDEAVSQEKYRNYGVLYNWQASLRICPFGWHLPRKEEWQILIHTLYPGAGSKMRAIRFAV